MVGPTPMYSLKQRLRFRTALTSFVYPAGYVANVRALGPYADEIELLFLESRHSGDLPDKDLLRKLDNLKQEFNLTYNVHLPTDLRPAGPEKAQAQKDTATLQRFIERTLSLAPTSFCLHLPYDDAPQFPERCYATISALLSCGINSRQLTVENLDYPLTVLADVIEALDTGVCFDIGHTLVYGTGFETHRDVFRGRIEVVHLHAPGNGRDEHNDISLLGTYWPPVLEFLAGFNGTVALELFSIQKLNASLQFLEPYLEQLS